MLTTIAASLLSCLAGFLLGATEFRARTRNASPPAPPVPKPKCRRPHLRVALVQFGRNWVVVRYARVQADQVWPTVKRQLARLHDKQCRGK